MIFEMETETVCEMLFEKTGMIENFHCYLIISQTANPTREFNSS